MPEPAPPAGDERPPRLALVGPGVILPLRAAVLRPGLPPADARFPGDDDPDALHAAALLPPEPDAPSAEPDPARVIACASLLPALLDDQPVPQLRGMAVHPDHRGQGLGAALLAFLEATAARRGYRRLWCNARLHAVAFYQRHGWTPVSETFDIPGVGPHRRMTRDLSPP